MSSEEADSGERRVEGKPSHAIKEREEESGATVESSSSSSDGSNEPEVGEGQSNLQAASAHHQQHPTALLEGSHAMGMPNHNTASSLSIRRPGRVFGNTHQGDHQLHLRLPTPNLPPQMRMEPEMHHLYSNQLGNRVPWTNWHPQNQIGRHESLLGPQEVQFQGLLNQGIGSGSFYSNGDIPCPIQHQNLATHQALEPFTSGPSNFHSQSEAGNWIDQEIGERTHGHGPSNPRYLKNTVYDPIYESMGLPVDPHLRIFITRHNGGNQ